MKTECGNEEEGRGGGEKKDEKRAMLLKTFGGNKRKDKLFVPRTHSRIRIYIMHINMVYNTHTTFIRLQVYV